MEISDKNPYEVRHLKISGYAFLIGNKIAPVLIERKYFDDVASSLFDGTWENQQRQMRKAQFVLFGGDARNCDVCYVIEGVVNRRITHGEYIGNSVYGQVRIHKCYI
jgi:hypothetical protein